MPESEDPQPPSTEETKSIPAAPTPIAEEEYHTHADAYLDALQTSAEAEAEKHEDMEVEFSVRALPIPHAH